MKVAVFSDIHGNITGLQAVLSHIAHLGGAELLFCAGDMLGAPGTEDLLDILIEQGVRMVQGNEDEIFRDIEGKLHHVPEKYHPQQIAWAEWLHARISTPYWNLLASLPVSETVECAPNKRLIICHATPTSPYTDMCAPWVSTEHLNEAYAEHDADIIAYGHFHAHHVIRLSEKLLVNVASVGHREDGMSAWTLIENRDQHWLVKQYLVPYDLEEERRLRRESQAPQVSLQRHGGIRR